MSILIDYAGGNKVRIKRLLESDTTWKKVSYRLHKLGTHYFKGYYMTALSNLLHISDSLDTSVVLSDSLFEVLCDNVALKLERELGTQTRLEEACRTYLKPKGLRPFPHQVEASTWISGKDRSILALDPGLGKSAVAMMAIPENSPVLVIGPNISKTSWQKEIPLWRPDLNLTVIDKLADFRWPAPSEVVMCTFDGVPPTREDIRKDATRKTKRYRNVKSFSELLDTFPEGMLLVIDEIHKISNPNTSRYKRIDQIVTASVNRGNQIFGLTGTPLPNREEQLWAVLRLLKLDQEVFGNKDNFYKMYGARKDRWGGWKFPPIEDRRMSEDIPLLLSNVMIRKTKKQVRPDLPDKVFQFLDVDLKQKSLTKKLQGAMASLKGFEDNDILNWLASQPLGFEFIAGLRRDLAVAKIPFMLEMVEDYEENQKPIVVASAHRDPIEALRDRKGWGVITGSDSAKRRSEVAKKFMNGELLGIGLTIQAGGVAISLNNTDEMIFVDLSWTPGDNTQAEDRILRALLVDKGCLYKILTINHPLERRVHEVLTRKTQAIETSIDSVALQRFVTDTQRLKEFLNTVKIYKKQILT
ncbi:MAG: DEAD/DEAH box helicase [Candidatus Riesia sp.]|nr:DEAD/DEAH box helicase [Candidatus Riesia sp.]